ncbi:MAG: DinB family protein [Gemmatimonadaceae bacterium]
MRIVDIMLGEYVHEAAQTRKVLERIPTDKAAFTPHEKSMTMGKLAVHVADLASWTTMTLTTTELDMAGGYTMPTFTTTDALLDMFDRNVEAGKMALMAANDEQLGVIWTLKSGEHVLLAMPRGQCLRSMCFNHTVHHRGQLSVYLRLIGVPVPGMYGPSADEM